VHGYAQTYFVYKKSDRGPDMIRVLYNHVILCSNYVPRLSGEQHCESCGGTPYVLG
jgi:hypothetical protein